VKQEIQPAGPAPGAQRPAKCATSSKTLAGAGGSVKTLLLRAPGVGERMARAGLCEKAEWLTIPGNDHVAGERARAILGAACRVF